VVAQEPGVSRSSLLDTIIREPGKEGWLVGGKWEVGRKEEAAPVVVAAVVGGEDAPRTERVCER
jgi:hypothetical protein